MSAKQILRVEDNGENKTLQLNEENLRQLLSEDIANLPVVVISVAGAYRTGKSFLLNLMMRYITAPEKSRWLENKCESFQWKSGCEPHTNGLVMSPPKKIELPSGETAVLLLMDTQGLSDGTSGNSDRAIFSLSALISSLLVSNVMNDLKGSDLEYQHFFTEIARHVGDTSEGKPFQDLCFLIRDWPHKQNFPLGGQGGTRLIEKRLESSIENISKQRKQFKESFTSVSGFNLPHPGKAVAESPTFDGDAKDMDPEFSATLEEFMAAVLSPDKLKVKMNGGCPMTCAQLVAFVETYVERLQSDDLVRDESILEGFARANNLAALEGEFCRYVEHMKDLLADDSTLLDARVVQKTHSKTVAMVLESLNPRKLMTDPAMSREDYISLLKAKMEGWFQDTVKFQERFEKDQSKAREHNEKLLEDCIKTYTDHKASLTCSRLNPRYYLPYREKTIRDMHTKARERALEQFNKKRLDVGCIGSEFQSKLENDLEGLLTGAIAGNNRVVRICWVAVGVVGVVIGGAGLWYYRLMILQVLKHLVTALEQLVTVLRNLVTVFEHLETAYRYLRRLYEALKVIFGFLGFLSAGTAPAVFAFISRETPDAL